TPELPQPRATINETRLLTGGNRPSARIGPAPVPAAPPVGRSNSDISETESILLGLHDEVDLLKDEIAGLRDDLSALIEIANRPQQAGRPRGRSDVPEPLRREVNAKRQVRVQTGA